MTRGSTDREPSDGLLGLREIAAGHISTQLIHRLAETVASVAVLLFGQMRTGGRAQLPQTSDGLLHPTVILSGHSVTTLHRGLLFDVPETFH